MRNPHDPRTGGWERAEEAPENGSDGYRPEERPRVEGQRPPGSPYWLIVRDANGSMEVLTIELDRGEEALPVFSFREEAALFLRLGSLGDSWWARESGAGEVISLLYGLCAGVKKVALDPVPRMVVEEMLGLVSLDRGRFLERVAGRGRRSTGADKSAS